MVLSPRPALPLALLLSLAAAGPAILAPILATGAIRTLVRGEKHCLTANASAACRPDGRVLPPRPSPASVCAVYTKPCDSSSAQVWRLSAMGEIESSLARDRNHSMCLDGGGAAAIYTNWCVRGTRFDPSNRWNGQLWHWSTANIAGAILQVDTRRCATSSADSHLSLAVCTAANERAWTLPKSAPLPPLPPPPPPPPPPATPCPGIKTQTNCTSTHGRCTWNKTGHCAPPPPAPWPPPPPPRE